MIKRIKKRWGYFVGLLLMLIAAITFNLAFSKIDGFLLLNAYHLPFLDFFFRGFTALGDGIFTLLIIGVLLIFNKRKKALTLVLAYVYSGLCVQILKRIFHFPRPKYFFEQAAFQYQNFVDGVHLYNHNAFPSGHTTTAFALATVLILVYKKKKISLLCLTMAILVGYSRIYLAQHFLTDVIVGAAIGTVCAIFSYRQVYITKLFRPAKVSKRYKRFMKFKARMSASLT